MDWRISVDRLFILSCIVISDSANMRDVGPMLCIEFLGVIRLLLLCCYIVRLLS